MDKYINADELKRKRYITEEVINPFTNKKCENVIGERRYVTYAEIDEMPAADVVEVKHGHWIEEEYSIEDDWGVNNYHYHICSECHKKISNTDFSKSWVCCPYCGADMRGETDE